MVTNETIYLPLSLFSYVALLIYVADLIRRSFDFVALLIMSSSLIMSLFWYTALLILSLFWCVALLIMSLFWFVTPLIYHLISEAVALLIHYSSCRSFERLLAEALGPICAFLINSLAEQWSKRIARMAIGKSCSLGPGRTAKLAFLNDTFWRGLKNTGIPASNEPNGLAISDWRCPAGVTFILREGGKCLSWDATAIDTMAESYRIPISWECGCCRWDRSRHRTI